MNNSSTTIKSTELKNYNEISKITKSHPVIITHNDIEDTVLLNYADYTKQQLYIAELEEKIKLYSTLLSAMDDINQNKVINIDEVFDHILAKLNNYNT